MANIAEKSCQQAPKRVWYLDSCISQHLTNNKNLFIEELRPKCLNFTTADSQTLCAKSMRTIAIPLDNRSSIRLKGVAYAPKFNSNLISLGQLRNSNITYVDSSNTMTLMQKGQIIAHARQDWNLFILNLATPNKVMQVTQPPRAIMTQGRGCPTYLISKNKQVRIWHQRLGHVSYQGLKTSNRNRRFQYRIQLCQNIHRLRRVWARSWKIAITFTSHTKSQLTGWYNTRPILYQLVGGLGAYNHR